LKNLFAAIAALLLPVLASAQLSISGKITNYIGRSSARRYGIAINNPAEHMWLPMRWELSFYRLKAGNYMLKASYIGYQAITKSVSA
jgi:iron complex outermembrane receptor protein